MTNNEKKEASNIIGDLFNQRIQLELLFSTGAIVTLANLPTWIDASVQSLSEKNDVTTAAFYKFAEIFISAGINALIIGFALNIFFRVLTLCYLGIDYVFPEGILKEKLKFSDYANQKILGETDTQSLIERTERFAGFSFAFSIFLAVKLLGIGIVFNFFLGLLELLDVDLFTFSSQKSTNFLDWVLLLVLIIVLGIFDYFVFVLGRKFNILSKFYYPIYLFFNFISLNFLIKKQKLILHSNFGRFKTGLLIMLSVIVGIMFTKSSNLMDKMDKRNFSPVSMNGDNGFFPRFYDDEREDEVKIRYASIPSRNIAQNQIALFCVYSRWNDYDLENFYKPQKDISSDSLQMIKSEDQKRLGAINQYFIINIDDTLSYSKLNWFHYRHPKTKQDGFLAYVPVKDLTEGVHKLSIKYNIQADNKYVDAKKIHKIYINFVKEER